MAWAAINKNTINNCIGICLLKMLRNAVYSFSAPFAVEIVIVMIEHYIHTDRLITYIFMCCIGQQEFLYIVTNQVHIHSEQYIKEEYVLFLFVSCYQPLAFVCLRRVINCRLKYYKPL